PAAGVARRHLLLDQPARLAVARALARQPGLLPGERDALRLPRDGRRERLALPRRDSGARDSRLPLVAVAVHERAQAEGLRKRESRKAGGVARPRVSVAAVTGLDPSEPLGR